MRRIKRIYIHSAATTANMDIGAKEIEHLHTSPKTYPIKWGLYNTHGRGWKAIGYHLVLRRNGEWEDGRPFAEPGAHVKGDNSESLGLCMVGMGYNYTPVQWAALPVKIKELMKQFPGVKILGHYQRAKGKPFCPGFDVMTWLKETFPSL